LNASTYQFLARTLETTRVNLLRSNARIFCGTCQSLKQVTDFFPNKECQLECRHRRPIVDAAVLAEYEAEKELRKGQGLKSLR
jgi:hypothetical protein